jgi:hypothetical protein
MHLTMDDSHITTVEQLPSITSGLQSVELTFNNKQEMYTWMDKKLTLFRYHSRKITRKAQGAVLGYLMTMTGLSRVQVKRLASRKKKKKCIRRILGTTNRFPRLYGADDIALLVKVDNAHERLAGPATKAILNREYAIFGKLEYERIKEISVAHLYRLRGTRQYTSRSLTFTRTKPTKVSIGIRKKPIHGGKPGCIRVDSVHQGDLDKEKGVYHINMVDEVTQWEVVGCIEGISEQFLLPLLEELLEQYPFVVWNFHSDNGSEYINARVARLLQKLIVEQTKSRSRHTNDNALVEGKNNIIRKHMGYMHIPKRHAERINQFYRDYFIPYLNFHRPCNFATDMIDARGKVKKVYDVLLTPFEKFKTVENCEQYLKPGTTLAALQTIADAESDTEYAEKMSKEKSKLFKTLPQC